MFINKLVQNLKNIYEKCNKKKNLHRGNTFSHKCLKNKIMQEKSIKYKFIFYCKIAHVPF